MLRFAAAATLLIGTAAAELPPEAKWLASGADIVAALTTRPGECLAATDDREADYLREIGRAAFQSPLLLGGQAARNGLSCASCHVDGRANSDFFLEGLSDAPGTADVSSSIFSKVRDDGVFNPLPIPTLVGVKGKETFGERAKTASLAAFVESAVADEFQGAPMSAAILDGLVAYMEAMDESHCPAAPLPVTPRQGMISVARALAAALEARERGDHATADFLLVSAQAAAGLVHARYPDARFEKQRAALLRLSAAIGAARSNEGSRRDLADLEREALRLGERLDRKIEGSLYDADAIRAALRGSLVETCVRC